MQLEILNTLMWVVYCLVFLLVFVLLRNKSGRKDIFKFKYCFVLILVTTLLTHKQFYTLTEKSDMIGASQKFTFSANNNTIDNYLEENKGNVKVRTEEDRELELKQQQEKSKALAKEIEQQSKEK